MRPVSPGAARRRRLLTRALPLSALAIGSFIVGASAGRVGSAEQAAASRFAAAWARHDFAGMHALLNPDSRARFPAKRLRREYLAAERTATVSQIRPGHASGPHAAPGGSGVSVPMQIGTVAFGNVNSTLEVPFENGGITWSPRLLFPGLRAGERLRSEITLAPRAPILAADGTPLAEGSATARSSPLGSAAIDVTGTVGRASSGDYAKLASQGFAPGAPVGLSGLERAFNPLLAGKPGGRLLAVGGAPPHSRVLATSEPTAGSALRTTVDPKLQRAAVAGLGGREGGVAVLSARSGAVLALAGSAFSAPQPPGSTFKVVTTTAALQAGVVSLNDQFPQMNGVNVGGRFVANDNNETCGGSFVQAFEQSCNSVFVPLGPKIGSKGLVSTAEHYGFNQVPALYDAQATAITDPPKPSIPEQIPTELDLGVSAIGQGDVLATPLEMASIAQTVASRGLRKPTPIVKDAALGPSAGPVRVMSPKIAAQLRQLMIGVVSAGTGTAAALPGVQVAGKTGTAELGPKPNAPAPAPGQQPKQAIDAWFTCFAPAGRPRLVVAVMLVNAKGDGGTVAAPVAHDILTAGLG